MKTKLLIENLTLDCTDGTETFVKAKTMFPAYFDSDYKNYGTNQPGKATESQAVVVHELVKNATFAQMYGPLSTDLNKLCLTQAQILNFIRKYPQHLRQDGYATFFLFKVGDQFFVACVDVNSDGQLRASVYRFEDGLVRYAGRLHRLVLPQLSLSSSVPLDPLTPCPSDVEITEIRYKGKIYKLHE